MRRLIAALALGVTACSPTPPPPGSWALAPGERLLQAQARAWWKGQFQAMDATVSSARRGQIGMSWAATGFEVALGEADELRAAAPLVEGAFVRVRPGAVGVVLPLAERAPAAGGCWVVGVVCAEDGAALGGATVHATDSAGGNQQWQADTSGCFAQAFPALAKGGSVSLMAYGKLADGRPSEGRTVKAVAVPGPGVVVVALETAP